MINIKDRGKCEERIRIYEKQRVAYIPKSLIKRGFVGDVSYLISPCALVLVSPGSSFKELEESVRHVLNEIRLMRMSNNEQS